MMVSLAGTSGDDLMTLARLLADPVAAEARIKEFTTKRDEVARALADLNAQSADMSRREADMTVKAAELSAKAKDIKAQSERLDARAKVLEQAEAAYRKEKLAADVAHRQRAEALAADEADSAQHWLDAEAAEKRAKEHEAVALAARRKMENALAAIKGALDAV